MQCVESTATGRSPEKYPWQGLHNNNNNRGKKKQNKTKQKETEKWSVVLHYASTAFIQLFCNNFYVSSAALEDWISVKGMLA